MNLNGNSVTKKAWGISLLLHLALVGLLGGQRFLLPPAENLLLVDWVGKGDRTIPPSRIRSSPGQFSSGGNQDPDAGRESSREASSPKPPGREQGNSGSGSAASVALQGTSMASPEDLYKSSVLKELRKRKSYPALARRLGQTGRVILRFRVSREGQVESAEILEPSPYPSLNDATARMLAPLKRLPPIPESLGRESWEFTVPVEYRLE